MALLLGTGCATRPAGEDGPVPRPAPAPDTAVERRVPPVQAAPVLLVQATSSAPNEAERHYAAKLTARLADWLQESGIPVRTVTDDQVARGGVPASTTVVLLPCNPTPGSAELRALRRVADRGGKLVVLYSASPELASLMGFTLGPFKSTTGAAGWNGIQFTGEAPAGMPARVEQDSRNIRPAYPARQDACVLAWWASTPGPGPREPAWVRSRNGFWMSHILLESDVAAKKQMLVSLLGSCDPRLLQAAAAHAVNQAGTLGLYASATQAMAEIGRQAVAARTAGRIQALLHAAEPLRARLSQDYQAGAYLRVLSGARQLDRTLTEAFALIPSPRSGEFRGAWNHSGTGFAPGRWDETCQILARAGMTAILPNIQRPWAAHYPSSLIAASDTMARLGDQVQACLDAARKHGLATHAWVILWSLEGAPESTLAPLRRAGRLQVSASGQATSWLCPSHPENRAFEVRVLRELVSRYPALDGVQLDYIRYKSPDTCYCAGCRARFAQDTGIPVRHWPADVRSGPAAAAYRQWRQSRITSFVADVHRELKRLNPRLALSASVYAGYPGCADSIGQDWAAWLRQGLVDFVCPMNYTASPATFMAWYRQQVSYPGVRGRLYAGIGVTSLECRLNAVQTINQILALRREGATGFTLFEANPTLQQDILPYLGLGLTAP